MGSPVKGSKYVDPASANRVGMVVISDEFRITIWSATNRKRASVSTSR